MTNQQTAMIKDQTIKAKFYMPYWIDTLLVEPIAVLKLLHPSSLRVSC